MKRFLFLLASPLLLAACNSKVVSDTLTSDPVREVVEEAAPTPTASAATYSDYQDGVIGNGEESVLFFKASWCPSCKANHERLSQWFGEGLPDIAVYRIDYDSAVDLKNQFGIVQQDTFVKIDGAGNEIERITFPSESKLRAMVQG